MNDNELRELASKLWEQASDKTNKYFSFEEMRLEFLKLVIKHVEANSAQCEKTPVGVVGLSSSYQLVGTYTDPANGNPVMIGAPTAPNRTEVFLFKKLDVGTQVYVAQNVVS